MIPVEYDSIYRSEGYIIAEINDEREYYSLNGERISDTEYVNRINIGSEDIGTEKLVEELNEKYDYVGIFHNDIAEVYDGTYYGIVDKQGELIVPLEYHGKRVAIAYDEEVQEVQKFASWGDYDYIKKAKLYDAEALGTPILFCYEEPIIRYNFPMSDSALYTINDNQLQCLVTGYECGGSARGDYVCFWREREGEDILIGYRGSVGGFGGYASYSAVYDYTAGTAQKCLSYEWIGQTTGNYSQEELLEDAGMFYDEDDIPYTRDTIQDAASVNEYLVNEERVSIDKYNHACQQYLFFELFR